MNNLEINEVKATKLSQLEDDAISELSSAIKTGTLTDTAKMSMQALQIVAKNRQTVTSRLCLQWSIITSLGTEGQQRKYATVTQPQIGKMLGGKK